MDNESNFYARLRIPVNATAEEIRRAYRDSARQLHPDTNTRSGDTELFLTVQDAYEVISDPVKRAAYDSTLPAECFLPPPVKVNALYSRSQVGYSREPQLVYTLIEIKPTSESQPAREEALNLCLVLDCSTSMRGEVLDTLKTTAIELVRQLQPADMLSIVVFNDKAQVIVPGGQHLDRGKAETGIRMLNSGGGTEIYQGVSTGYRELLRSQRPETVNHLILVTDGHTYGDEEACYDLARDAQIQQIGISALGIGNKWNDEFLDRLTSLTGGTSFYVNKPDEIRKFLQEKVIGLGKCIAPQVIFSYETDQRVEVEYAFRLQPESAPLDLADPLVLGSIPNQGSLLVLLQFRIIEVPANLTEIVLADGRLNFSIPGFSSIPFGLQVRLVRPTSLQINTDMPPIAILQALSKITLYRMQEKALHEAREGNVRAATTRLQFLATNLLARGENELAQAALREAANIENLQSLSEEGQKKIKYGTRALMPIVPPNTLEPPWENFGDKTRKQGDQV